MTGRLGGVSDGMSKCHTAPGVPQCPPQRPTATGTTQVIEDTRAHCRKTRKSNANLTELVGTLCNGAIDYRKISCTLRNMKATLLTNRRAHRQSVCINVGWGLADFRSQRLNMHALT